MAIGQDEVQSTSQVHKYIYIYASQSTYSEDLVRSLPVLLMQHTAGDMHCKKPLGFQHALEDLLSPTCNQERLSQSKQLRSIPADM